MNLLNQKSPKKRDEIFILRNKHEFCCVFAFAKRSVDSNCKGAFALAGGKSTEEPRAEKQY